jgi:hypothetical protein
MHRSSGAKEQNRTADTAVFSRVLYLLSYLGAGAYTLTDEDERWAKQGSNP